MPVSDLLILAGQDPKRRLWFNFSEGSWPVRNLYCWLIKSTRPRGVLLATPPGQVPADDGFQLLDFIRKTAVEFFADFVAPTMKKFGRPAPAVCVMDAGLRIRDQIPMNGWMNDALPVGVDPGDGTAIVIDLKGAHEVNPLQDAVSPAPRPVDVKAKRILARDQDIARTIYFK